MNCDVCIGTSDCDQADVYRASTPRARKPHRCCECSKTIAPGEEYERVAMLYDGEWLRYDTCASCKEIRDVFVCGKGWMFGSIWEEMREYVFPELTTASECFTKLSAAAKERVLVAWRRWKGLEAC